MARNGALVPESKSKLESLKSEAASSLNVNLKQRRVPLAARWSSA